MYRLRFLHPCHTANGHGHHKRLRAKSENRVPTACARSELVSAEMSEPIISPVAGRLAERESGVDNWSVPIPTHDFGGKREGACHSTACQQ
jgi:hypothetical protein